MPSRPPALLRTYSHRATGPANPSPSPSPSSSSPAPAPSSLRLRSSLLGAQGRPATAAKPLTTLQEANPRNLPEVWFNANFQPSSFRSLGADPDNNKQQPDERKVKLGKTLRILQERLPTLLQTPLPQEVLSPSISLHLFPSTHPHLPTVSGRVAYVAALWTSPIAWNRVPIVGNVRLEILSERMVATPAAAFSAVPRRAGAVGERLVVRWRTVGKSKNWGLSFINGGGGDAETTTAGAKGQIGERRGGVGARGGTGAGARDGKAAWTPASIAGSASSGNKEFTGLFIFDFDSEGRILSHTIEHVQEGGQWEQGVGAKVLSLTDWLLGGMKGGSNGSDTPLPVFAKLRKEGGR